MKESKSNQFRNHILTFFKMKRKQRDRKFTSPELLQYVQKEMKSVWFFPDSLFRELRQLRQDNKLNYECPVHRDMLYKILPLNKVFVCGVPVR